MIFKENKIIYLLLGLILTIHILFFSKLIYFPYPELFIYPYLTNNGLSPYSQILDQHFPGVMFFPVNLDNLGMNTPQTARIWSIGIVIIIHLMLFLIGKEILKSKRKALLLNALYLLWNPFFEGWVLWIDNFLPLFLLPSFYVLYKKNFFWGGFFLGLAIVFKQTVIPLSFLVLFYIFLATRNIKKTFAYVVGILIPVSLMLGYIISLGSFKDFWYWTVTFNLTTYAQFGTRVSASSGYIARVFLVYAASLLSLFSKNKKEVYLLFIFLFGSMIGAFERTDFVHLQPSLPFAILATVIGVNLLWKKKLIKFAAALYLIIALWWLNIFFKGHLSQKIILFDDETREIAAKIKMYTRPGEKIFIFGAVPHLYQMTDTLPAGDIFVFQFPWFLRIAENRLLEGIKADKPEIIVSDPSVNIEGQRLIDFASEINEYIYEHYEKIEKVGTTDILRRKS